MASNKKLYVGNLSHDLDNNELKTIFQPYGEVVSAQVIMDRDTGRSKGFGFVEMGTLDQAQEAITALNGTEAAGRAITVNEARPQADRNDRGARGFGGGNGGRRY